MWPDAQPLSTSFIKELPMVFIPMRPPLCMGVSSWSCWPRRIRLETAGALINYEGRGASWMVGNNCCETHTPDEQKEIVRGQKKILNEQVAEAHSFGTVRCLGGKFFLQNVSLGDAERVVSLPDFVWPFL